MKRTFYTLLAFLIFCTSMYTKAFGAVDYESLTSLGNYGDTTYAYNNMSLTHHYKDTTYYTYDKNGISEKAFEKLLSVLSDEKFEFDEIKTNSKVEKTDSLFPKQSYVEFATSDGDNWIIAFDQEKLYARTENTAKNTYKQGFFNYKTPNFPLALRAFCNNLAEKNIKEPSQPQPVDGIKITDMKKLYEAAFPISDSTTGNVLIWGICTYKRENSSEAVTAVYKTDKDLLPVMDISECEVQNNTIILLPDKIVELSADIEYALDDDINAIHDYGIETETKYSYLVEIYLNTNDNGRVTDAVLKHKHINASDYITEKVDMSKVTQTGSLPKSGVYSFLKSNNPDLSEIIAPKNEDKSNGDTEKKDDSNKNEDSEENKNENPSENSGNNEKNSENESTKGEDGKTDEDKTDDNKNDNKEDKVTVNTFDQLTNITRKDIKTIKIRNGSEIISTESKEIIEDIVFAIKDLPLTKEKADSEITDYDVQFVLPGGSEFSYTFSKGYKIGAYRYVPADDSKVKDSILNYYNELKEIKSSDWARDYVFEANKFGITDKNTDYAFTSSISREDFCDIAVNMLKSLGKNLKTENENKNLPIADTESENVLKLYNTGIVLGKGENENGIIFAPNDSITREEAATILYRIAKLLDINFSLYKNTANYKDADSISYWAADAVNSMYNIGVMNGMSENEFSPKGNYTTEQSVATMVRLYKCN